MGPTLDPLAVWTCPWLSRVPWLHGGLLGEGPGEHGQLWELSTKLHGRPTQTFPANPAARRCSGPQASREAELRWVRDHGQWPPLPSKTVFPAKHVGGTWIHSSPVPLFPQSLTRTRTPSWGLAHGEYVLQGIVCRSRAGQGPTFGGPLGRATSCGAQPMTTVLASSPG